MNNRQTIYRREMKNNFVTNALFDNHDKRIERSIFLRSKMIGKIVCETKILKHKYNLRIKAFNVKINMNTSTCT